MRILEARDGFIKFESNKNVSISSFLQINSIIKNYIAQVIQVKRFEDSYIAFAKILFLYDGSLRNYDKSLPDSNAKLAEFPLEILSNYLEYNTPIYTGDFIGENYSIPIDESCFNKKMLICVDSNELSNKLISNISSQFLKNGKVLIIDMLGNTTGKKFVAGSDFKLPLNAESLDFMYEDCLNDATSDSKNLIKEIFQDLSEYAKTVPFLPFTTLKTIVDDMVEKSHIFKLLVLKNKLSKFDKAGYFATTAQEVENIKNILNKDYAIIDLSKLDAVFQNRYLKTIYSILSKENINSQVFVEASNSINKKNIQTLVTSSIATTFVTHSRFKYISEIKSLFENFIIEPSFSANEVFKIYNTFLKAMNKDNYLVVGEGTNYIPFVVKLQENADMLSVETLDAIEESVTESIDISQDQEIETLLKEPQDPQYEAIEKKSENLIERISEEVSENFSEAIDLFSDSEAESTDDNENSIESNFNPELNEDSGIVEEWDKEDIVYKENIENTTKASEEILENEQTVSPVVDVNTFNNEEDFHTRIDEIQTIEVPSEISEYTESLEKNDLNESPKTIDESNLDISDSEIENDNQSIQEINKELAVEISEDTELPESNAIEVINTVSDDTEIDEIIELSDSDIPEDAILVELEESSESSDISEELEREIIEDVDKVFTAIKDDSLSDSDLDFIDELNEENNSNGAELYSESDSLEEIQLSEGMQVLPEIDNDENSEEFLEPLEEISDSNKTQHDDSKEILETRNASTPIVPVYEAEIPQEDLVSSDPIEQGDTVKHAKYGSGVVEKMIKYGTKTLYSINFDNVGRRLLDPTLTEIKRA